MTLRPATPADLPDMESIQQASPTAAQWPPADYLNYRHLAAAIGDHVVGFVVWQQIAPDELEILNLAVHPAHRRKKIGQALLAHALSGFRGKVFLEVRESNHAAIAFYAGVGFRPIATRKQYYEASLESGIVMEFQKC